MGGGTLGPFGNVLQPRTVSNRQQTVASVNKAAHGAYDKTQRIGIASRECFKVLFFFFEMCTMT